MNTLLLVCLAAVVIFLFLKRRNTNNGKGKPGKKAATKRQQSKATTDKTPYHSTMIVPGAMACDAARALSEKSFLDSDKATPGLPLPNCTAPRCRCKYVHADDRREDDIDRRFESGMQTSIYQTSGKEERRTSAKNRGRRKSDHSRN